MSLATQKAILDAIEAADAAVQREVYCDPAAALPEHFWRLYNKLTAEEQTALVQAILGGWHPSGGWKHAGDSELDKVDCGDRT